MQNISDPPLRLFALEIGKLIEENNLQLDLPEFIELSMQVFKQINIPLKNSVLSSKSKKTGKGAEYKFMVSAMVLY